MVANLQRQSVACNNQQNMVELALYQVKSLPLRRVTASASSPLSLLLLGTLIILQKVTTLLEIPCVETHIKLLCIEKRDTVIT